MNSTDSDSPAKIKARTESDSMRLRLATWFDQHRRVVASTAAASRRWVPGSTAGKIRRQVLSLWSAGGAGSGLPGVCAPSGGFRWLEPQLAAPAYGQMLSHGELARPPRGMGGRAVSLTCFLEPYGLCLLRDVLNDEVRRCAQVDMFLLSRRPN